MKDKFIHICFIVDSSSSMSDAVSDVVGGFNRILKEQKENKEGQCSISLFTFGSNVEEKFIGKDVSEVSELDYHPSGMTAMNDGIGTAIDKVGEWLRDMKEEERPSKNLIVIMTDGEENFSKEYSLSKVQEMIKHQTDKYSWDFMYIGADVTNKKTADNLGIKTRSFTSKLNHFKNYDILNAATTKYRCASSSKEANSVFNSALKCASLALTEEYEKEIGTKLN